MIRTHIGLGAAAALLAGSAAVAGGPPGHVPVGPPAGIPMAPPPGVASGPPAHVPVGPPAAATAHVPQGVAAGKAADLPDSASSIGAAASLLGKLNAAHASSNALEHASPKSVVGAIATYKSATLTAEASIKQYTAAVAIRAISRPTSRQ